MQQLQNFVSRRKRVIIWLIGLGILGYLVLQVAQFVVFGLPQNPPVTYEVQWDSPRTEELWTRACQDCHSNETAYPWYSYLFPSYILVMKDVEDGREKINVSTNNLDEAHETQEVLEDGEMPPLQYLIVHPDANLTDAEKVELIAGLEATFNIRFDD
jgi:hypothetical protein